MSAILMKICTVVEHDEKLPKYSFQISKDLFHPFSWYPEFPKEHHGPFRREKNPNGKHGRSFVTNHMSNTRNTSNPWYLRDVSFKSDALTRRTVNETHWEHKTTKETLLVHLLVGAFSETEETIENCNLSPRKSVHGIHPKKRSFRGRSFGNSRSIVFCFKISSKFTVTVGVYKVKTLFRNTIETKLSTYCLSYLLLDYWTV